MRMLRVLGVLSMLGVLVGAQQAVQDPVLKARAERARAQGVPDGDLPPVPKAIIEPPPLPPPESSLKDTRKGRSPKRTKAKSKSKSKSKTKGRARAKAQDETQTEGKALKKPGSKAKARKPARSAKAAPKRSKKKK